MTEQKPGLPIFLLKPGEMFITDKPCAVSTLLGSCVAVTMFSRRLGVGAICHALLPSCSQNKQCDCRDERFRYVDCSVRGMLEAFKGLGITATEIETKLFGGSDMFLVKDGPDSKASVGRQNIAKAREILTAAVGCVAAADVGGVQGRKIVFYACSGEVFLKRLNRLELRTAWPSP